MNQHEITKLLTGTRTNRDKQTRIGPSEIHGCSRKVWHRLNNTPTTNRDTLKLAAWMGTAIHKQIEEQLDERDPFEINLKRELEVEHDGLMGHVDCYDVQNREVIDWKTTTKKNMSKFPSTQQRTQVQLYGYLLSNNGYPVDSVTLVAIARDGDERDIKIHTEPYDERYALEGLAWLSRIVDMIEPPDPEMPARVFCSNYCQFYDPTGEIGCTGK